MPKWVNHVRVKKEWEEGDVRKVSAKIGSELRRIDLSSLTEEDTFLEDSRLAMIDYFEDISNRTEDTSFTEFNILMEDLYDWADTPLDGEWNGKKLAWIETF